MNYFAAGGHRQATSRCRSPPAEPIAILLPQAFDGWPRTVLTVVEDAEDETVAPRPIITLRQEAPWHSYKATYVSQLRRPRRSPNSHRRTRAQPSCRRTRRSCSWLRRTWPRRTRASSEDGEKSEYAELFDIENDGFLAEVTQKRKKTLSNFNKTGEEHRQAQASGSGQEPVTRSR